MRSGRMDRLVLYIECVLAQLNTMQDCLKSESVNLMLLRAEGYVHRECVCVQILISITHDMLMIDYL